MKSGVGNPRSLLPYGAKFSRSITFAFFADDANRSHCRPRAVLGKKMASIKPFKPTVDRDAVEVCAEVAA